MIIQKSEDGKNVSLLRLWDAYFEAIIGLIKPNEKGYWEGVTLHYHLDTGWYDEPWECDDIPLFLKQLESIDENKLKEAKLQTIERDSFNVLQILKTMLKNTIDSKGKTLIEYD